MKCSLVSLVLAAAVGMNASGCAAPVDPGGLSVGAVAQAVTFNLNGLEFTNGHGTLRTFSANKKISFKDKQLQQHPFFQSIGTNGRACIHCHLPGEAWTITPANVAFRFSHPIDLKNPDCLVDVFKCPAEPDPNKWGLDPIFRTNDGANSPLADVSSAQARQAAYSQLLTKGLIRVGMPVPVNAEFELVAVDDPYQFSSASELSLFRRPLPTTNLRLSSKLAGNTTRTPTLTSVMWDGRETLPGHDIVFDLMDQANGATLGHAEAARNLTAAERDAIVEFETDMHTAQLIDKKAGNLHATGANGGPDKLAEKQTFYVGINDVLAGDSLTGAPFDPKVFTIFDAWVGSTIPERQAVVRGQALFNTKAIAIRGVGGLNDDLGVETIPGTCTSCHDSPNYGHHSVALPIDIGVAAGARRTADMPLYTLRHKTTFAEVQTTDPGRALVTGKWKDIGKFKGPILRGLASRAPYFHDGSAATLLDAVNFYDARFGIGFTAAEKADLVAFLSAL